MGQVGQRRLLTHQRASRGGIRPHVIVINQALGLYLNYKLRGPTLLIVHYKPLVRLITRGKLSFYWSSKKIISL